MQLSSHSEMELKVIVKKPFKAIKVTVVVYIMV